MLPEHESLEQRLKRLEKFFESPSRAVLLPKSSVPKLASLEQRIQRLETLFEAFTRGTPSKLLGPAPHYKTPGSLGHHHLKTYYDIKPVFTPNESSETPLTKQEHLGYELHSYLIAQSLGIDTNEMPLNRYVSISVYLPEYDLAAATSIDVAITGLLYEFGFDIAEDFPPEMRSWFKLWFAKTREKITQPELMERFEKIERGVELAGLQKQQADIDHKQAEAVGHLMAAFEKTTNIVCVVGSILIVKTEALGNSNAYVRTLTPEEMIFLSKNQHLLKSPDTILEALSSNGAEINTAETPKIAQQRTDDEAHSLPMD